MRRGVELRVSVTSLHTCYSVPGRKKGTISLARSEALKRIAKVSQNFQGRCRKLRALYFAINVGFSFVLQTLKL